MSPLKRGTRKKSKEESSRPTISEVRRLRGIGSKDTAYDKEMSKDEESYNNINSNFEADKATLPLAREVMP